MNRFELIVKGHDFSRAENFAIMSEGL
jgi:hypothetical protein